MKTAALALFMASVAIGLADDEKCSETMKQMQKALEETCSSKCTERLLGQNAQKSSHLMVMRAKFSLSRLWTAVSWITFSLATRPLYAPNFVTYYVQG